MIICTCKEVCNEQKLIKTNQTVNLIKVVCGAAFDCPYQEDNDTMPKSLKEDK
jgi:hypothetical protein